MASSLAIADRDLFMLHAAVSVRTSYTAKIPGTISRLGSFWFPVPAYYFYVEKVLRL